MHRKVAAVLVALLALGLASCGGSEPVLTRAQLTSKIAVACRQALTKAQAEMRAGGSDRSGLTFVTAVLDDQKLVMGKIKNLNPPAAAKSDFETYKQSVQKRIDLLERVKSTGSAGVQRAMQTVQREGEAITRTVQTAVGNLGVSGCI